MTPRRMGRGISLSLCVSQATVFTEFMEGEGTLSAPLCHALFAVLVAVVGCSPKLAETFLNIALIFVADLDKSGLPVCRP